mgnify:CR=1 FL=1
MPRSIRLTLALLALAVVAAACTPGDTDGEPDGIADLPEATPAEVEAFLAADPRPAVVNVWASWCGPCRAEAPLLTEAHAEYGDVVHFVGIDVQDNQASAKSFIEEFELYIDHFFDPDRAVPAAWGGFGVPITYFVAPDGEILEIHNGIIDERSLVQGIEDLLALDG